MVDQDGHPLLRRVGRLHGNRPAHVCASAGNRAGRCRAWVILDRRHREYYLWGTAQPGKTPKSWLDSGYMKKADSIAEIARLCGIDACWARANGRALQRFCRTRCRCGFRARRPRLRPRPRRSDGQAQSESRRDRAGAVLRGCHVPRRRRYRRRHRDRRARARAARGWIGHRGTVRHGQFDRLGVGRYLPGRRREHRRFVRVRISRGAAACGTRAVHRRCRSRPHWREEQPHECLRCRRSRRWWTSTGA